MRMLILSLLFALGYALVPRPMQRELEVPSAPAVTDIPQKAPDSATIPEAGLAKTPQSSEGATESMAEASSPLQKVVEVAAIDESAPARELNGGKASTAPATIPVLIEHLVRSLRAMEKIPTYTATLEQQIQKRGRLLDPELIDIKVRRSPFSVYLKWQDDNQEVLYVEGLNDGRVLVHPTRGLARLRPIWRLRPDSQQAMRDSRYPVTELGIEKLSRMALNFYQQEKKLQTDIICTSAPVLAGGRPATEFKVAFASDAISPLYATSRLTFDHETGFLVSVESHSWDAQGNPGMLLELYRYHRIVTNVELTDEDFSELNPAYHFQR